VLKTLKNKKAEGYIDVAVSRSTITLFGRKRINMVNRKSFVSFQRIG